MLVPEPPAGGGSSCGPVEFLLPPQPRTRGDMDTYENINGELPIDCSTVRSTCLPILDGPAGPILGEDTTESTSKPELVCRRHSLFGCQSKTVSMKLESLLQTLNDASLP